MKYTVYDTASNALICSGLDARDTLTALLEHVGAKWFLHWKPRERATNREWHLVITSPDVLRDPRDILGAVISDTAETAMWQFGQVLIAARCWHPLDWLAGSVVVQPFAGYTVTPLPDPTKAPTVIPAITDPMDNPAFAALSPDTPLTPENTGLRLTETWAGAPGPRAISFKELLRRLAGDHPEEALSRAAPDMPGFEEPIVPGPAESDERGPWTVTIVMADRAFGGREEGGWYFDTFDPFDDCARERAVDCKADRLFWNLSDAIAYSAELDEKCKAWNVEERRPRKDSVASRGVYEAYVFDGYPARIPAERPIYE